jgi:hypothetical protein
MTDPSRHPDNAPGQDLGFGLGEGRVRDLGRTTKDGSSQRPANSGYSEALTLSLLGTWNRQHGTVLHSDQRVFLS